MVGNRLPYTLIKLALPPTVSDGAARVHHVLGEQRLVPVEIMCVESVERMLDRHPRIAHTHEVVARDWPLTGFG